jgi:hypothetical protein
MVSMLLYVRATRSFYNRQVGPAMVLRSSLRAWLGCGTPCLDIVYTTICPIHPALSLVPAYVDASPPPSTNVVGPGTLSRMPCSTTYYVHSWPTPHRVWFQPPNNSPSDSISICFCLVLVPRVLSAAGSLTCLLYLDTNFNNYFLASSPSRSLGTRRPLKNMITGRC